MPNPYMPTSGGTPFGIVGGAGAKGAGGFTNSFGPGLGGGLQQQLFGGGNQPQASAGQQPTGGLTLQMPQYGQQTPQFQQVVPQGSPATYNNGGAMNPGQQFGPNPNMNGSGMGYNPQGTLPRPSGGGWVPGHLPGGNPFGGMPAIPPGGTKNPGGNIFGPNGTQWSGGGYRPVTGTPTGAGFGGLGGGQQFNQFNGPRFG